MSLDENTAPRKGDFRRMPCFTELWKIKVLMPLLPKDNRTLSVGGQSPRDEGAGRSRASV